MLILLLNAAEGYLLAGQRQLENLSAPTNDNSVNNTVHGEIRTP